MTCIKVRNAYWSDKATMANTWFFPGDRHIVRVLRDRSSPRPWSWLIYDEWREKPAARSDSGFVGPEEAKHAGDAALVRLLGVPQRTQRPLVQTAGSDIVRAIH